jgi:hypothetical protein
MKIIAAALIVLLAMASHDAAQKRRSRPKPVPKRAAKPEETPPPRIIGTNVVLTTKNGDKVSGSLQALTAYSARVKSSGLESTVALETVSLISFGGPAASAAPPQPATRKHPDFSRDAAAAAVALGEMSALTKSGTNYTDYGQQLTELRRKTERYVSKYASSDDAAESRAAALIAGSLADYTWARTIWALKLGYSTHADVDESDAPAVGDTIAIYPELRTSAASGTKFSADKLVSGLWKHAEEKIERVRLLSR